MYCDFESTRDVVAGLLPQLFDGLWVHWSRPTPTPKPRLRRQHPVVLYLVRLGRRHHRNQTFDKLQPTQLSLHRSALLACKRTKRSNVSGLGHAMQLRTLVMPLA